MAGIWRGVMVAGVCAVAGLAGCTVGPDFRPPKADVPGSFSEPGTKGTPAPENGDMAQWWKAFKDPKLTELVERAEKSNLDLKQAEARIRQARASLGVAQADQWPSLNLGASAMRSRNPGSGAVGGNTSNLFQAGLDASWEMDIFGGVRRNVEAAKADVQASYEDRNAVMVTLTSEVALDYVTLRGFQQRIAIAQRNLEAQKHSADVTRERFKAGFVGALDVANADALVATTASQIPVLETSAKQTIYSLGILLGNPPETLVAELTPTGEIPVASPAVPAGIPSELLRRRPDVRAAEARIHGATARIGVAVAQLYPDFTLSASGGFEHSQIHGWADWASRFWSIGPAMNYNVFDAGRTESNIKLQQALADQSLLTWRQTVLTALADVENALVASTKEEEHRKALTDAVTYNRKAVDLATQLYVQGETDFLSVLDAERQLYSAEDALSQSNQAISTDLVALYKALGGGWTPE